MSGGQTSQLLHQQSKTKLLKMLIEAQSSQKTTTGSKELLERNIFTSDSQTSNGTDSETKAQTKKSNLIKVKDKEELYNISCKEAQAGVDKNIPSVAVINTSHSLSNSSSEELEGMENVEKEKLNATIPDSVYREQLISLGDFYADSSGTAYFKTNLDFSDRSFCKGEQIPALRLGYGVPKPILNTENAPFTESLNKRLKDLHFWGPSCIQSVVWPAIFRNRWIAAIAPPHSGKTMACLLPLLSNMLQYKPSELPSGNGPVLLVLCSSWKKVHHVYEQCQLLLEGSKKIRTLVLYSGGGEKNKEIPLLNGCDILICTPSCLIGFLKREGEPVTNLDRCCHLLLDDADCLSEKCNKEVMEIVQEFTSAAKKRQHLLLPLQIMLCAEKWTKGIAFLHKCFPNPALFFTSFLESAIFAQVPIRIHVCQESQRGYTLLSLLEATKQKTVICTTDVTAALEVRDVLQTGSGTYLLVHEELPHYVTDGIKRNWNISCTSDTRAVLIVTDKILPSMDIRNANSIIHYDLPETSRLQFGQRFSCITDYLHVSVNEQKAIIEKGCICHILVTENCQTQAPNLVKLLKRTNSEIPLELKHLAHKQYQTQIKKQGTLCNYMKAFGICSESQCTKRHIVNGELDQPKVLPHQGDIRALVNFVIDATHFYVRILEYVDPVTHTTKFLTAQYAEICFQLNKYYKNEENKIPITYARVGNNYATEIIASTFHRVKVLSVNQYSFNKKPEKVSVQFLDEGWIKNLDAKKLFLLPSELCKIPPLAVEVYMCKLKTVDNCSDWNPQVNLLVHNLIGGKEIEGKIVLCLDRTIWLDPIVIRNRQLKYIQEPVNILKLDKTLRDEGYALENPQHLTWLSNACKGKVSLPLMCEKGNNKNNEDKERTNNYAFLDLGVSEKVFVSSVISPHHFFIQKAKFIDCLDSLLEDVADMLEKRQLKKFQILQKELYCLAPFPEDNRARIDSVTENEVHVFYVDFGDTATITEKDLYVLPSKLLLLPFQAIQCELAGVSPPHGGWTEVATDAMLNFTRDDAYLMKQMDVKALKKLQSYSEGNNFVVELHDVMNISELLIKEGLALPAEVPQLKEQDLEFKALQEYEDILEYSPTSDDEMLPGEKDAAALMFGVLCGILSKKENDKSEDNSDEELKPLIPEYTTPLQAKLMKSNETMAPIKLDPKLCDIPPLTAIEGHCERFTPQITWWNKVEKVIVSVKLAEVKLYDFTICHTGFKFSATVRDKFYCLEETLYAGVIPEKTVSNCLSQSVELIFQKTKSEKWPRLISKKGKVPYIKLDFNHLETDSESDIESNNEKQSNKPENLEATYVEDSPESEESSDEDDLRTDTWQRACEPWDPYNIFH